MYDGPEKKHIYAGYGISRLAWLNLIERKLANGPLAIFLEVG